MGDHNVINDYIAGAIGGAAGLIVGHPFDTTKVQLQTRQTSSPYKGTWDAMRSINKSGLAKGFFRGLGFPLASYGLVNSVFFGVYGNTVRYLKGSEQSRKAKYSETFLAGCCGGIAQLFVACPVDVVKVVLQSQIERAGGTVALSPSGQSVYFKGPVQCLRTLYVTGGIRRCYRGMGIQTIRDLPASAAYFLIYETMFCYMMENNLSDSSGVIGNLVSGGMAGVLSWSLIVPLDVIKSQIQADYSGSMYKSAMDSVRTIYQKAGLRGFYTGWLMICIRAFPVNAVTVLFYDKSLKVLNKMW